jgi:hypothetical protein
MKTSVFAAIAMAALLGVSGARAMPEPDVQVIPSATVPPAANPESQAGQPEGAPRRVCKVEETLGTRLRKRTVCRTEPQWRRVQGVMRREMRHLQNFGGNAGANKPGDTGRTVGGGG